MNRIWIKSAGAALLLAGAAYVLVNPPRFLLLSGAEAATKPDLSKITVEIKLDRISYTSLPPQAVNVAMAIRNTGSAVEVPKDLVSEDALNLRLVFRDPAGRRVIANAFAKPIPTPPPPHTVVDAKGRLVSVDLTRTFLRKTSIETTFNARDLYRLGKIGTWTVHAEVPVRIYPENSLVRVPALLAGGEAKEHFAEADSPGAVGGMLVSNTVKFVLK
jgi:hypothetical protein